MDELAGCFAAGKLTTAVHATVPLAEAAEAHRLLDDRTLQTMCSWRPEHAEGACGKGETGLCRVWSRLI